MSIKIYRKSINYAKKYRCIIASVLNSIFRRGELDDEVHIVGLNLCLVRRLVSDGFAAFFAAVDDDISLFGVGHRADGAENTSTLVGSVAGIYIYVQRRETERAVVSRGVAEGLYALAACGTYEARIVFRKSFRFHFLLTFLRKSVQKFWR